MVLRHQGEHLERLIRVSRLVPADVELGFHFCYGDGKDVWRREPADAGRLVEIANALSSSLGRALNWIHMPVLRGGDQRFLEPLAELRLHPETELYIGLLGLDEPESLTGARIESVHELVGEFGIGIGVRLGTACPGARSRLIGRARCSQPARLRSWACRSRQVHVARRVRAHPARGVGHQPVESFGLKYDTVENHGWYRNLDPTVEQLARHLRDGDVLIDYSGGTGILLDRLLLRVFDRQIGMMIVDSSPKFLRVALDRFRGDERVAFRVLRYLKDEKRLQLLDEVVDKPLLERGVEAIASTNAIHLY